MTKKQLIDKLEKTEQARAGWEKSAHLWSKRYCVLLEILSMAGETVDKLVDFDDIIINKN